MIGIAFLRACRALANLDINSVVSAICDHTNHFTDMKRRTPEQISRQMGRIRKKDTKPELFVRTLLHRAGYRFRLHRAGLPGTPDVVFPRRKKALLVHGCFWHRHDCVLGRKQPKSNQGYWLPKLARNVERDVSARLELEALGWKALVVWECETRGGDAIFKRIVEFLGENQPLLSD